MITLPPTFPLPFWFFISPLLFTLPLHFLHHFFFLIFLLFFSSFYFCINSISFLPFNSYFSHEKTVSTLSLSRFLFFLKTLIKVDGFFFLMCYGIVFFKFPITKSSLSFVGLVVFWFGLILNSFGNKNLSL